MESLRVDVVVIGSGPAGQKAAIQAAKLGRKVIVIEKDPHPGGACLYSGTIPSKTFREAVVDLTRFHERSFYATEYKMHEVTMDDLNQRLQMVTEEETTMVIRQFKKNEITVIKGMARFETPHQLIVVDNDYQPRYQIETAQVVIATGSTPRNPGDLQFDDEVILDSTRLLSIKKLPKTMLVLGGGVIGTEYATFFAALGTEVTIIDKRANLLPFIDKEIGIHLQTALAEIGLSFLGEKETVKMGREGDKAVVSFKDGSVLEADCLLYALGRQANISSLNIENAGLKINERGYIPVNALFQTAVSHIYAVGDVIGGPCLASTSMEQGRLAARNACGEKTHQFPSCYPIGIYTIPEISSCGYTEEELKEMGCRYEVGRAYYNEIARSHIAGSNLGLFKILFHADTLEILGVHIIGRSATELIHIGQVAMSFHAHIDYFVDQIFNYPTYAEGYRVAALNGLNKIELSKFKF